MWAMDNWMYSTINQVRLRMTPSGTVIREPIGANGAQWGVTQDNYGKLWFQAGASGMPGYFQYPVEYGAFDDAQAHFEPNLNVIWGAPVLIADMQGGLNAVRMPDGSLNRATAGAGNDVYRGDHLPKDLIGDYFYGEVVGRVVRRLHPVVTEGFTQLRNVYPLSEFIRSTDPLFRPGRHDDGAGRDDVHHGHLSRDCAGIAMVGAGYLSARPHRSVRPGQSRSPRPHLAPEL